MKRSSGFIAEQAQKLCQRLKFTVKHPELGRSLDERTSDEIVEALLLFMKDGDFKELGEITNVVRIPEDRASAILEGMVRENFAKRGYKLTEKTVEFARIIEDFQSLPEPDA